MFVNYYEELQVHERAGMDVIQAAYRALMRVVHPDVAETGDGERARRVTRAYEVLRDPQTRQAFDLQLAAHRATAHAQSRPEDSNGHQKPRRARDQGTPAHLPGHPPAYPGFEPFAEFTEELGPVAEAFVESLGRSALDHVVSQLPPPLQELYRQSVANAKARRR